MIDVNDEFLQQKYIEEGVRLGRTRDESKNFVEMLWPTISIPQETNRGMRFHITPSTFATLAGCCLGADTNWRLHTGKRSIAQSGVLIEICCAVIGRFAGGALIGIAPDVTFTTPLKVGETATLYAIKPENMERDWYGPERKTILYGENSSGGELFAERTITTRTPTRERKKCKNN